MPPAKSKPTPAKKSAKKAAKSSAPPQAPTPAPTPVTVAPVEAAEPAEANVADELDECLRRLHDQDDCAAPADGWPGH